MRSSAFGDSNHPGALACGQTGGIHQDRAMDKNSIASSWVKGGSTGLGPKYKEIMEIMGCLWGLRLDVMFF